MQDDAPTLAQLDRLEEPDSLIALRAAITARLPKGDLPDVVLETMARTGFATAFTMSKAAPPASRASISASPPC